MTRDYEEKLKWQTAFNELRKAARELIASAEIDDPYSWAPEVKVAHAKYVCLSKTLNELEKELSA